jgi:hypothetical protein
MRPWRTIDIMAVAGTRFSAMSHLHFFRLFPVPTLHRCCKRASPLTFFFPAHWLSQKNTGITFQGTLERTTSVGSVGGSADPVACTMLSSTRANVGLCLPLFCFITQLHVLKSPPLAHPTKSAYVTAKPQVRLKTCSSHGKTAAAMGAVSASGPTSESMTRPPLARSSVPCFEKYV